MDPQAQCLELLPLPATARGVTPHEKLQLKRYAMPLLELGELATVRQGREPDSSIDARWSEGLWLGRSVGTGEHLVGLHGPVHLDARVRFHRLRGQVYDDLSLVVVVAELNRFQDATQSRAVAAALARHL